MGAGVILPAVTLLALASLGRLDARAVVPGAVFSLLRSVPFLALLPVRSVERMARDAVLVSVDEGDVVVHEGDAGDRFYVVSQGAAVVTQAGVVLRRLGAGQWFGEIALLRDVPRTATVSAASSLQLACLEREVFLSTLTGTDRAHRAGRVRSRATWKPTVCVLPMTAAVVRAGPDLLNRAGRLLVLGLPASGRWRRHRQ